MKPGVSVVVVFNSEIKFHVISSSWIVPFTLPPSANIPQIKKKAAEAGVAANAAAAATPAAATVRRFFREWRGLLPPRSLNVLLLGDTAKGFILNRVSNLNWKSENSFMVKKKYPF